MKFYPKISIVTPCYNHEHYIGETIESIISQDYPNLQYVVINDGSADDSGKIIQSFSKYLYYHETWEGHRPGPVWAINRGFSHTDGDIMGWISSDDILLKKSLFTLAKVFTDLPKVEWLTGLSSTINTRGEMVKCLARFKNLNDFLIGNWSIIQQESTFFKRSLWQKAGGQLNENYLQAFDTELWTRFFKHAEHYHLQAPVGAFRKGSQSRSVRNINEFLEYNQQALDTLWDKAEPSEKKRATLHRILSFPGISHILSKLPDSLGKYSGFSDLFYKSIVYSFNDDHWNINTVNCYR